MLLAGSAAITSNGLGRVATSPASGFNCFGIIKFVHC